MIPENSETYLGLDLSTQKVNRKQQKVLLLIAFHFHSVILITQFKCETCTHFALRTNRNIKMQIYKIERERERLKKMFTQKKKISCVGGWVFF